MTTRYSARVEREDLITFINACFAGTKQESFYEPWQVVLTLDFLHEYMSINYRDIYVSTLALGINSYNQGKVIAYALKAGAPSDEDQARREWFLMLRALDEMPAPQAYRALSVLKEMRINNRRARALIKTYLRSREDLPFHVVKYRRLIKGLVGHAHVRLDEEAARFLYGELRKTPPFETPIYESYRRALYSVEAVYELPFSVAQGFASLHGINRAALLKRMAASGQMTRKERMRTQKEGKRRGVAVEFTWDRADPVQIAAYMLSLPLRERKARRAEMDVAMEQAVRRVVRAQNLSFGRVAVVADCSYSTWGSHQNARRPLAMAFAINRVLREASVEHQVFWTQPEVTDDWMLTPSGQTNLARKVLDALETAPDTIVIISDGFENDPPGGVGAIASVYRDQALGPRVNLIHLNPVISAQNGELKELGDAITSVGLRHVDDLGVVLEFARFAEGQLSAALLRRVLAVRVDEALDDGFINRMTRRLNKSRF